MRILKRVLFLIAAFLFPLYLLAQNDLPDKPEITRVTVDTSYHGPGYVVIIEWLPSLDTDVEYYRIYKDNNQGAGLLVATVPNSITRYIHNLSVLENLKYSVSAVDNINNESLRTPGEHRAVLVHAEFDTCYRRNIISWNPYEGWENNISHYAVHVFGDCEEDTVFIASPDEHQIIHKDINENSCYKYLVETVKNQDNLKSFSNTAFLETRMPDPPSYLLIDYVDVVDNTSIELSFTADVSSRIRDFQLLRSTSAEGNFLVKETYKNHSQSTTTYTDQVTTSGMRYFYRIDALYQPEGCPYSRVLASSNTGSSILLSGEEINKTIYLNWTPYVEYPGVLEGYEVLRKINDRFVVVSNDFGPDITDFEEAIDVIMSGPPNGEIYPPSGEILYMVRAVTAFNPSGSAGESHSNIISVELSTSLFMPNAFTPNGDGNNERFGPIMDFAPKEFLMVIYDRSGQKLFETRDPYKGWDGTSGGGRKVMEGVYIYHVQYQEYTGPSKTVTGNVTVLYP